MTSVKGYLGHSLGAAGAIEAVVSVLTVADAVIPPTAGTTDVDPTVGLDVVLGAPRPLERRVVLSNSFGFGGHNGTLVIGARLAAVEPRRLARARASRRTPPPPRAARRPASVARWPCRR